MRYWLYDKRTNKALGPHLAIRLRSIPGFGPESKVAPAGAVGSKDWKLAKEFEELKAFFAPAAAPPEAAAKPKP